MQSYPRGLDYPWLASDRHDHVAIFYTSSEGPVPFAALSNESVRPEDIERLIGKMLKRGSANLLGHYPDPSIMLSIAERGLFVYDWAYQNEMQFNAVGAYQLVATPTVPVETSALVADLSAAARAVKLPEIAFDHDTWIHIRALVECSESEDF
jgi:hypothetical protein